jgi:GntR family transcriptional regulator of arabinose operon
LSIQQDIAQRGLTPHTRIPSEVSLARQYQVSHGTITKALEALVHDGVLYRLRPQGTFVAPPPSHNATTLPAEEAGSPTARSVHASTTSYTSVTSSTKPGLIGMLVPYMTDSFLHNIVLGVQTMTRAADYGLSFAYSENDPGLERYHIEQFLRQGVAGIIIFLADHVVEQQVDGRIVSVNGSERIAMLRMLQERNVPFVLLDRYVPEIACNYVISDDFSAGYAATQHLAALGHQRIGFISIVQQVTSCIHRYNGYLKCLQDQQLAFDESLFLRTLSRSRPSSLPYNSRYSPYELDSTDSAIVCDYLRRPDRPTAIVAMNEYVALQVLQAAEQLNLSVPDDLALVGCGGGDIGAYTYVPLTSIIQSTAELGRQGTQILLDLIARRYSGLRQVVLPVNLMVRKSSGAEESTVPLGLPSYGELQHKPL